MAPARIGTLRPEDRQAVFETAKRLGVDPYQFGAVIHQESGFRPNVFGGAGGNYYGLIQFGGPERARYLDKSKIGKYTIAEQMPAVERFLLDRGYKPGKMGVDRLYATILGGNPNALTQKDSFGTSAAGSVKSFLPGGSLYKRAQGTLGDPLDATAPAVTPTTTPAAPPRQQGNEMASSLLEQVKTALPYLIKAKQESEALGPQSLLPSSNFSSSLLNPEQLLDFTRQAVPMPQDFLELFKSNRGS